jgi:hypothetical protein
LQQQKQLVLLDDLVNTLTGIWKYSSLDYFLANKGHTNKDIYRANEYAIRLMHLWDELDRLTVETISNTTIELEGKIIGKKTELEQAETSEQRKRRKAELTLLKILRTQLEDYLHAVR